MFKTWNHLTMDELIFHLNSPLEGTNQGMIKDFFNSCGIITIVAAAVLIVVMVLLLLWKQKRVFYVTSSILLVISAALLIYPLNYAWNTLEVSSYKDNQGNYSTFIEDNYVSPTDVSLAFPEQKRNLIYIYLESMETTYADEKSGGAFEESVIPELTEIALANENFSGGGNVLNGGTSLHCTTWTVAAMFAQTSGLPLIIPMEGNEMDTQDSFFRESHHWETYWRRLATIRDCSLARKRPLAAGNCTLRPMAIIICGIIIIILPTEAFRRAIAYGGVMRTTIFLTLRRIN